MHLVDASHILNLMLLLLELLLVEVDLLLQGVDILLHLDALVGELSELIYSSLVSLLVCTDPSLGLFKR